MTTIYVTREVRCWVSGVPPMIGFWSERNKRAHQFSLDSSRKTLRCSTFSGSDVLFRNQTVYTSCASCSLAIPVATLHLLRHVNFYFLFLLGRVTLLSSLYINWLLPTAANQTHQPMYTGDGRGSRFSKSRRPQRRIHWIVQRRRLHNQIHIEPLTRIYYAGLGNHCVYTEQQPESSCTGKDETPPQLHHQKVQPQ